MAKYVDGFVIPIPKGKLEQYREIAQKAGEVWKEHGALEYFEAAGDDLDIENVVSFKKLTGIAEDETVIFAWIVYESRAERDRINALVMEDARIKETMCAEAAPFDYKRMAYGGFNVMVEA